MNRRYDILDSCDEPQFGSDSGQFSLEWEDANRHVVLKSHFLFTATSGSGASPG